MHQNVERTQMRNKTDFHAVCDLNELSYVSVSVRKIRVDKSNLAVTNDNKLRPKEGFISYLF